MLAYLIQRTARHLKRQLDRELKLLGITSAQFSVMNQIEFSNNKTAAYEIAYTMGYDKPTVSAIVYRLHIADMIVKHEDPDDKRKQNISLTEKGIDTLHQLRKIADDISDSVFNHLSEDEKEILKRSLCLINNKLEDMNG